MDVSTIITIIIALVGMILGVAGYLSTRDNKTDKDAEWKGSVNAKLDIVVGMQTEFKEAKVAIQDKMQDHETRISILEKQISEKE